MPTGCVRRGDQSEAGRARSQRNETERHRSEKNECRLAWVSETVLAAWKPGNAGGVKGPHFRQADQSNKGEVIDDESGIAA